MNKVFRNEILADIEFDKDIYVFEMGNQCKNEMGREVGSQVLYRMVKILVDMSSKVI